MKEFSGRGPFGQIVFSVVRVLRNELGDTTKKMINIQEQGNRKGGRPHVKERIGGYHQRVYINIRDDSPISSCNDHYH